MKRNNKILPLLLAAALWAVLNSSCNTVEGAGKDIEKTGEKIQGSANRNR